MKEANFAPSTERSRDPLTTMTQCVLVGKEPNSQSTVIHMKSLSLPFPFRVSVSLSLSGRAAGEVPFFPPPMYIPKLVADYFLAILMFSARSTRIILPLQAVLSVKRYRERFPTTLRSGCASKFYLKWTLHTNIAVLVLQNKKFLGSPGPRNYIS